MERDKPHKMDFKCQCKRCVRNYTITHEDNAFLRSIGVLWNSHERNSKVRQEEKLDNSLPNG